MLMVVMDHPAQQDHLEHLEHQDRVVHQDRLEHQDRRFIGKGHGTWELLIVLIVLLNFSVVLIFH